MKSSSFFWGFVLLVAGVLTLLSNLGILKVQIWSLLWPTFLIALGLWTLYSNFSGRRGGRQEQAEIALEGASQARIQLNHGAGRLEIGSGDLAGSLLQGNFGGGLELDSHRSGDRIEARLSVPTASFPIFWSPGAAFNWAVRLNRSVPLELDFNTGAGESEIDLSDLLVKDLRLQTGASSSNIVLPAHAGSTRVRVEAGAASVRVRVPEGVAARIHVQSGLSGININTNRFQRSGSDYCSPDYDSAENRVDLEFQTGVGSVEVD